jgi:predicted O-linked N-acetylglucosamine transferase (SPINDLY family)
MPRTAADARVYPLPCLTRGRLLRAARKANIDISRFIFSGPVMPKTEHLKRLTLADMYLDTHVYNGHTTGSDALWAGVPMVTLQGDSFPSRVGASLARAVGMPEMVTETWHEYEELAVGLGNNPDKLKAWRYPPAAWNTQFVTLSIQPSQLNPQP